MAYPLRSLLPDGYFHIWLRGVPDAAPFPEPDDKTLALVMLMQASAKFEVKVEAACVMSTHYHAVVDAAVAELSRAMQWFHSRYALGHNRQVKRFGHAFAERFSSKVVEEEDVYDRCGYVLGNPVSAGLCRTLQEWPWSYYRFGLDAF